MIIETKVRKIGNSLVIVLPKEALQSIDATEGTKLFLTPSPHGSLRVTVEKPGFEEKAVHRGQPDEAVSEHLPGACGMNEPVWIDIDVCHAFHEQLVARFGGLAWRA